MTIAHVQPLDISTPSELTKAHDFLYEADLLVTDVRALFLNSDDFATAARLKDIQGRLADEIRALDGAASDARATLRPAHEQLQALNKNANMRTPDVWLGAEHQLRAISKFSSCAPAWYRASASAFSSSRCARIASSRAERRCPRGFQ
jgi:predicted component of type VI protein secretion system